jgi:hypothetical protein
MAMTDEEVETHYRVKMDMARERGETEMQTQLKAERDEAHPYRTGQ